MLRVIVSGLIGQHRYMGGVAWDYLNFVLGLHRLGHEVYYIEDSGEWPYNLDGGPTGTDWIEFDPVGHVAYLAATLAGFGLSDRWAYRFAIDGHWYGMPASRRRDVVQSADLLFNVSGSLDFPDRYRTVQRLIYIDTDPVFTQIALAQGGCLLRERQDAPTGPLPENATLEPGLFMHWSPEERLKRRVDLHDVHFTVGETLHGDLPETGHRWHRTKHPIVLAEWRQAGRRRDVYTTVMNWTSYPPVEHGGRSYGQKDAELLRFIDLPQLVAPVTLEIALARIHHTRWESRLAAAESEDQPATATTITPQERLRSHGWRIVAAEEICGDFAAYRRYLVSSKGEWSVAKHGYVSGRVSWFSGRSACYLAAGRPVVVQNTGFGAVLPVGEGALAFATIAEAAEALRQVDADYERHARAAAALASEYFDSDQVLRRIIDAC